MRHYPFLDPTEDDLKEVATLNAQPWQIEQLKFNPPYVYWGNDEDYMSDQNKGWRSPIVINSWADKFMLDELNELVNFYFFVRRDSHECPHCEGSDLNPATKKLNDEWYSFDEEEWVYDRPGHRYNNKAWQYHLTEVEVEALVKNGRLGDLVGLNCWYEEEIGKWMGWVDGERIEVHEPVFPTPDTVNAWAHDSFGHDAINRWIAVEARAKHLGIYGTCEHCTGGVIYDEPEAKLGLQMWFLHPRKGASRGVLLNEVKQEELPEIYKYLREAAQRNADRFSKIPTE